MDFLSVSLVIINAILVIITGVYAYLTYQILVANRKSVSHMARQTEEATRPYVLAHPIIREGSGLYELEITNLGKSVAYDVQVGIDKTFTILGGDPQRDKISDLPIFKEGMPSMAPGFRISFWLGNPIEILDEKKDQSLTPSEFTITAKYRNITGTPYIEAFLVNLRAFDRSVTRPGDIIDRLGEISKELSDIKRNLKG
jgi:hypothetical protein